MPIRNTTDESTQFGRYWSGLVRKSRTTRTTAAVVRQAICVRAPALSPISVFVGLPLTTNAPVRPAPMFAAPRPTMSVFSSTCSS